MKTIKKIAAFVLALFTCAVGAGCSDDTPRKVVAVRGSGSAAFLSSMENTPFEIKALGIKSERNAFWFEDYVCSNEGSMYEITNSKKKKIAQICLQEKSEAYTGSTQEIDLTQYAQTVLSVSPQVSYLKLVGDGEPQELYIDVEYRTEPLEITLENVNLYTQKRMPVLYSYSDEDITIRSVGVNMLRAGNDDPTVEEYEAAMQEKAEENVDIALKGCWFVYYKAVEGTLATFAEFKDGDVDGFATTFRSYMDETFELTKTWFNAAKGLLEGHDGIAGMHGAPALQAYRGITLCGDGELYVSGGDGGNGGNASDVAMHGAKGGDGGDSGSAAYCKTFINMLDGEYGLYSGKGGDGGYGTSGLGDQGGDRGKNGKKSASINAVYSFEK